MKKRETKHTDQEVFIIMREEVRMAFCQEIKQDQWRKIEMPENLVDPSTITSLKKADEEIISEQEAKRIIKEYNMSLVHRHPKGEIYEMPGNPFFHQYQNFYKIVDAAKRAARIESIARTKALKKLGGARPGSGRKPKPRMEV